MLAGYPLPGDEVRKKIVALGTLYCQGQQVFAGDPEGNHGYVRFTDGRRWNSHLY
ncbi:MAG: hypothetical protein HQK51_05025 [Oligoflexia bacterium]|nr:hypothetical protein [Oligoflexia bacterium]